MVNGKRILFFFYESSLFITKFINFADKYK